MIARGSLIPASLLRIREMSAKIPSPVGERFSAKTSNATTRIYLYDAIGSDMFESGIGAEAVAKELDAAQASGSKSLEVYINSPGGVIGDGMSIYSAIRRFKGSRTVYVDGWAASIASVIALAGDRVISAPGATWMIHEPMGGILMSGRRDEMRATWEKVDSALATLHESMLDVYEARTKIPRADLDAWMKKETYMTAAEAVEYGFSDEIAQDDEETRPMPRKAAAQAQPVAVARSLTPDELVAKARADRDDLAKRFAGASPSVKQPGQPGAGPTTSAVRKETR